MKTFLLALLALGSVCLAADQQQIVIKISDAKGLPVKDAQAVAILKSGAYQDCKLDPADGQFKCQPTEECVKIYAAAPGFEGAVKKYAGTAGAVEVQLKQNPAKGSAIVRKKGPLPGIEGTVTPIYDSPGRMYMYATKIGIEVNGRPAPQPVDFIINRPISAVSQTGSKFKIWVMDITPEVSLLEFTPPK